MSLTWQVKYVISEPNIKESHEARNLGLIKTSQVMRPEIS